MTKQQEIEKLKTELAYERKDSSDLLNILIKLSNVILPLMETMDEVMDDFHNIFESLIKRRGVKVTDFDDTEK